MFNEIIAIIAALFLACLIGYLAWDSYKEFKEHEPK
jgi:hypothetical protein